MCLIAEPHGSRWPALDWSQYAHASGSQPMRGDGQKNHDAHEDIASAAQPTGAVGHSLRDAQSEHASGSQPTRGSGQPRLDVHINSASAAQPTGATGQSSVDVHGMAADNSQHMRGGGHSLVGAQIMGASAAQPYQPFAILLLPIYNCQQLFIGVSKWLGVGVTENLDYVTAPVICDARP
jgi:hypothetical protein